MAGSSGSEECGGGIDHPLIAAEREFRRTVVAGSIIR